MARKRTLPAALMALPQALSEAVLRTVPEETINALPPNKAVELGIAVQEASRKIAEIIQPTGDGAHGG